MNFGDGFSVPQDRGFQFMGYWTPETPDKPVATRSIPVLVDGHGMRVANWQELPGDQGGYDWQELPGVQGGYAHQPQTYRGGQSFNSVQQLGQSGSCYQLSAGLAEGNILLNHIADSCTQPISDPIENLLVANNAAPITSVNRNVVGGMGMANEPLIRSLLTTNNTTPVAYVNRSLGSDTGMANGPLIADLLGAQNAASVAAVNRTPSIYMGMANRGMPNLLAAKNTAPAASIYRIPVSDIGMANTPLIPNFLATKNAAALASVNQAPASNMGLVNRPLMSYPLGNVAPVTSVNTIPPGEMSMARRLLTPNLNTHVDHWGDFITDNLLLGDPTRGSSSNLFSQSGSLHHVFQDGFPIPYRPLYDLNSPPRTAVDANSSLAASFHLTPVTPDQAKRLENNEPCVALNFSTGSSSQEKENQDNLVTTRGEEAPWNNGDQLLQNIVESSTVNSTPVKEQKELERGSDTGVDLNKTPQQKPAKRKRHRPKVVVEGNAKRTPKPATPKNPTMTEKPTGRRKYVRKTILKESATQQADLMREMADPSAELAAKSCRKALHFDLEKAEEDEVVGQMEKQHKKERACNSDSDSKPIELLSMASCESRKKSALQISQQSELPVGNHQIGTIGNHTSSLNQMTTENISLSERAAEGDSLHIEVFNTITRNLSTINADSCQRNRKNWSSAVHQNIHAERSSQIDFQVRNNCENLDTAPQLQPQSTLQSAPNILSNHNETRRSKRQFGHAIDKMHPCKIIPTVSSLMCQEMNESDINRSNPGASCLGVQKKKKTEDELHTNTSGMLSHTTAEENGLGQPISKGVNNVDANGFESPRNHETSVQRREHNEVNSPPRDWYVHSKANRYDWLMQQISLEQQSQTKGIGETNWLTEAQNFANNKKSNLIPPTPPRKAPALGNGLVVSVANVSKKQTVEHTQSKLVPSGRGSALGERKKLQHAYQQSSGGRTGPPVEQAYPNLMDEIIHRFEGLYISHRHQKALVPYKGNGALIPHEGIKNPRPRARVELDAETNRVWNLLMGKKRTEEDEALDKEKEKWWEEERRVFRGRADSFIARMHLVQGDRRFSKWKGSVVDSVIGVFLTQNVSDHLSSSAFMSLVAKFPPKSKCSGTCDRALTNILVEEPEVCVLNPYCTIRWHEAGNHPSDKKSPLTADESKEHQRNSENSGTETTSLGETCSQSFEDALSSQDSFDSSILQPNGGIRSYSGSNSDAEYPTTANILNDTHWSSKETLMQNATLFHELYSHVNGSLLLHSGLQHRYMQSRTLENVQQHMTSGPQIHEIQNFENYNQEPRHFWPSVAAEVHNRKDFTKMTAQHNGIPRTQEALTMGLYSLSSKQFMHRENVSQRGPCTSCNHLCNHHQCEANKTFQLQDTPVIGPFNPAKTFLRSHSSTMQPILNVEERINTRRSSAESNSMEPEHHTVKAHTETDTHVSKAKRGKSQDEKKDAIEWDDLRKQVQANDRKKESKETMDSLDYEAMRCADVKRISEAIEERGMNNMLAERIQDFLNRLVREHGSIDLEWLRDVPPDKAKEYLLSIRGLGLKSVECVRLLTLHHLAFPVDTNVGRIAVRLGWVPIQPLPESLQIHLLELYPIQDAVQKYLWPRLCKLDQRTLYELHYQLITFGKVFCTKKKPNCNACPMRGECRHFASAYASARLALPGPEDKSITSPAVPTMPKIRPVTVTNAMQLPYPEKNSIRESRSCEPIIEEPATPEPDCTEISETDIEDTFSGDDEIPTIKLNVTEFSANVQHYLQENMELQGADMSKALVALSAEAAYIPTPKLKNVSRLRTEHQVYELPDSHPLLKDVDRREPDDPSPYLLAIWTPGETANSVQPPEQRCGFQEPGKLCDDETCFSCNSIKEANSQTVRGTLLIPCRTAMRGSFPLNGTYFQVNEVFADHASSINPIDVPREWIWNLPRRLVYFGTSVSTIFRGLSTEGIQYCFWKGFVCVRGFDQKKRAPRPLQGRLHYAASKLAKKKSESKHVSKDKLKVSKLAKKKSERNK